MKGLLTGVLMLVTLTAIGQGDEAVRIATLTGITGMRVIVEDMASHRELESQIQADVERKLRTAGLSSITPSVMCSVQPSRSR